jgi:CubicO group peptidase (beta-lactamase class C family)
MFLNAKKMKRVNAIIAFLSILQTVFSQSKYPVTYQQLKEFEGLYEYTNQTTLKIAASPKDTLLYAIINENRYVLTPLSKDLFQNMTKDKVAFLRDKSDKVTGYSVGKDTFNLINNKVSFPKEMWFARIGNASYSYKQPPKLKDGLLTGDLNNTSLDKALLTEMTKKIIDGTYPNVHSVLIIKDGKLVFEEYFYEYDRSKLHGLRSATKSIVSALTGIAIEKGFIKSKDETILPFFPEYNFNNNSNEKKKITIEHLLTNQSGLDCDITDPKSEGNETIMSNSDDWIKFTLDLPMIDSAGGKGRYCSGNPITLGRIIEKTTNQQLPEFARQTLFKDLGIHDFNWNFKPDKSSSETFCQIYLNSRDMAKFGLLYLKKGKWNNKQVISSDWVQQSLTKHSVVQGVNYGYLWWIKYLDVDGVRYYGKAAQGNGGQKIYIWEEQNMVTVITGGNFNTQSPSDELIRRFILPPFNKMNKK